MLWLWVLPAVVVGLALAVALGWRPMRHFGREVQAERARELFRLQREKLESGFFTAASNSGKPRGLIWKECSFDSQLEFARDRQTGQILALLSVTISFEAVAGSDMEDLPAVGNLRNASAVFFFDKGVWQTVGKTVFNMNPDEALEHFKNQYERINVNAAPTPIDA